MEYQRRGLPYIHLLFFLNSADKFFVVFHFDKVICAKLQTVESDPTAHLTRIITLVMIYGLCEEINFYSPYMTNTQDNFLRCIKYYLYNFLEETFIQKNGYQLYQ